MYRNFSTNSWIFSLLIAKPGKEAICNKISVKIAAFFWILVDSTFHYSGLRNLNKIFKFFLNEAFKLKTFKIKIEKTKNNFKTK